MTLGEIERRMNTVNNWALEENAIVKDFSFPSFKVALEFVNKIADIAEKLNHHPDILLSFNKVRISSTTHSDKGLSDKDFDLAEQIDKIQ